MPNQLRLATKRQLTATVYEFNFEVTGGSDFSFTPGEYIQLHLGGQWRAYSVCRLISPYSFTLIIQLIPGGRASAILAMLKPGDKLAMLPPAGQYLRQSRDRQLCFIATSTGLSPCLAIIEAALAHGDTDHIKLIWGARTQKQLFYLQTLQRLASDYPNFELVLVLSKPEPGWTGETGRVTTYLRRNLTPATDTTFFVSGWHEMVEEVAEILASHHVPSSQVRTEHYD